MKKQGFVFMESVIVLMVVALALTMLISSYSLITRKTNEKEYYDRSSDKYLLYSITNIGVNDECNYNLANSCGYEGINLQADEKNCNNTRVGKLLYNCSQTFKDMNIRHIYVVDDIKKELSKDDAVEKYDNGVIEYMKTLKKCNDADSNTCEEPISYMIGVFKRSGNYYYSSIKIDAITEECEEGYYLSSITKKCERIEYVIKFDKQEGSGGTSSIKVSTGNKPGNISIPSKTGYTFLGYYTEENGEGEQYYDSDGKALMVFNQSQNITLYAHWTETRLAGLGTEEDPYKIQFIEDLVDLSNNVNNGETYTGKYFILTKNLDFNSTSSYKNSERTDYGDINGINGNESLLKELTTGSGFTPIGLSDNNGNNKPFKGIFDGKNYTIDNLYIYNNTITNGYLGLFSKIENGKVLNLKVNGKIKTDNTCDIGGIVGNLRDGIIENCTSNVNLESLVGAYALGGIVGWAGGTNNTIKNSINNGLIKNGGNPGGIIGYNSSNNLIIDGCTNNGTIENELGTSVGGIMGYDNASSVKNTTINNCTNNGKIITNFKSEKNIFIGGIVGRIYGNAQINNTHNINSITNETESFTTNTYTIAIGGIVGVVSSANGNCKINNTYNTGNIYGGNSTGGIVGEINGNGISIIDKSYNSGEITSNFVAKTRSIDGGGIIGYTNGGRGYVLNSYNIGKINSSNIIGGLIGYSANTNALPIIVNSYNKADIKLTSTNVYNCGIISVHNTSSKNIKLNNVVNLGNHLNSTNAVGISYFNDINTKNYEIQNVYYKNDTIKKGTNLTDDSTITTGKSESEMKNQTFVNTLNTNKNAINLSSIDSALSGYTLCNWKLGTSGYPELSC